MEIKEFTEAVAKAISEKHDDLTVEPNSNVRKNNDIVLAGVSIRNNASNVAPMIYVNDFYNRSISVDETADKVMEIYDMHKNDMNTFDVNNVNTFDNVKDNIIARVVNKNRNQHIMDECPYAQFGDLLVTFAVIVSSNKEGIASIKITNEIMNMWKVTLGDIISVAYQNTKKLFPLYIDSIGSVLKQMMAMHGGIDPSMIEAIDNTDQFMYVATTTTKQNGAYFISDKESLVEIADFIKARQFVILPSSVHELIIIPFNTMNTDMNSLLAMVKEVNQTQIPPDEILSDNLYFFDADTEELRDIEGNVIPFMA